MAKTEQLIEVPRTLWLEDADLSLDELATSDMIMGNLVRHYFNTKVIENFGRHLGRIVGDQAYKMAAGILEARARHLKGEADEGHEDG